MAEAALWTAADAAAATGGRAAGGDWAVSGISIDTRTLQPGDLFVALTGDARDGHDFVQAALEKGAGAVLVSREDGLPADAPRLVVADTLDGLTALGIAARARMQGRVIGVTGSVGKTSTKEALATVLARQGRVHASAASYNNHWGVPLTLARMPADTAFAVLEIGMNHAGEITPLTRMARPHVAIVTTVAPVHLEHFPDETGIAEAKAEIFLGLEPGGTAIINADNRHRALLSARAGAAGGRVVTFGRADDAGARLIRAALKPECSCIAAQIEGQAVTYKVGAPGEHWVINSLAILAAAAAAGADLAHVALAMADVRPPAGRGARHVINLRGGDVTLIDESYNANPTSMGAAIALLAQTETGLRGRRIAVMGDMLELGETGPEMHAGLRANLEENSIDLVFACGPLMAHLWRTLPPVMRGHWAQDSDGLHGTLRDQVRPGDVIMVKGSLGSRMRPVVDMLRALDSRARPAGAAGGTG